MESAESMVYDRSSGNFRRKILVLYLFLLAFNLGAWAVALVTFRQHSLLIGTSLLAYTFGLRHAVDADHIAAIDNVTRKLMHADSRPTTVGLMFSLGHSTVVVAASIAIAITAGATQAWIADFKTIGEVVGALVSTIFLLSLAGMNLSVLRSVICLFRKVRRGEPYFDEDFRSLLAKRGFLTRIFRPLFNVVSASWHMYFVGLLFGLGFDTATEVGLLGISATGVTQNLSPWAILIFPLLFTAGMTLIDTTDSVLMLGAYGWAFVKPVRKLYYNMTVTMISVVIALFVGVVEGLGLLGDSLKLQGRVWAWIGTLNDHFSLIGYGTIGVFIGGWALSVVIYKWKRFDEVGRRANGP